MRDKMLPRFAPDQMPAVPAGRGGGAGGGGGRGGRGNTPAAENHLFGTAKNKALTVAAPGLLPMANPDAVAAGATPALRLVSVGDNPMHGKLAMKPDGSFVYTPEKDYTGTDTFTYTVTIGAATSTPGTVTIAIK